MFGPTRLERQALAERFPRGNDHRGAIADAMSEAARIRTAAAAKMKQIQKASAPVYDRAKPLVGRLEKYASAYVGAKTVAEQATLAGTLLESSDKRDQSKGAQIVADLLAAGYSVEFDRTTTTATKRSK